MPIPAPRRTAGVAALVLTCATFDAAALTTAAAGTAFEVTDGGYLVTNLHVVTGCTAVRIRMGDGMDDATIVARDEAHDLALLADPKRLLDRINYRRITGSSLPYAHIRPDDALAVLGEDVIVVGFPLPDMIGGINVTTGIVSATSGPVDAPALLQISAPAQPGNSGGPLLDSRGQLLGVVSSGLNAVKLAREQGISPQNVNFAVQATHVRRLVEKSLGGLPAPEAAGPADTATVAGRARQFTFPVECQK